MCSMEQTSFHASKEAYFVFLWGMPVWALMYKNVVAAAKSNTPTLLNPPNRTEKIKGERIDAFGEYQGTAGDRCCFQVAIER